MVAMQEVGADFVARGFDVGSLQLHRFEHRILPRNQKNPNHPVKDEKGSRGATLITRLRRSLCGYRRSVDILRC